MSPSTEHRKLAAGQRAVDLDPPGAQEVDDLPRGVGVGEIPDPIAGGEPVADEVGHDLLLLGI